MAPSANRRSALEHVIGVTLDALHGLMRACESEGSLVVIEARALPLRGGVTRVAGRRESGCRMVRIRGLLKLS